MSSAPARTPPSAAAKVALLGFIAVWLGFQVLFPLRHLLYPGSPSWNEEGHKFAWQMKLRDKKARAVFTVRNPETGREWRVTPRRYLLRHQARKVATRPEMILQFAHYLERLWTEDGVIDSVEVRVRVCASLNGRPAALLIDPERDLTKIEDGLSHADWVLPLHQPFERPPTRTHRRDLSC